MKHNHSISVNILGSCVCRDIFNYDLDGEFVVNKYVNGSSILSCSYDKKPAVSIDAEQMPLKSHFERRSCCLDYNKTIYDFIFDNGNCSDYLIISFSDVRMNIAEIWDNNNNLINTVSYGTTFRENYENGLLNGILKDTKLKIYDIFNIPIVAYYNAIDRHIDKLLQMYPKNKIIVIEDYFVDKYVQCAGGGITSFGNTQYVKKINTLYRILYSYLYSKVKNINVIKFPTDTIADKNHKLGLFGLHYTKDYYEYALNCVKDVVK